MKIGHDLVVRCPETRSQIGTAASGRLEVGNDVFINEGVIIFAELSIIIGDNAKIGDFSSIHDSNFHEVSPGHPVQVGAVTLERNVWLGRNVVVLPGVRIGANSVVAAGAVVTADVSPNVLVGGNPARLIREFEVPDSDGYVRN